MIIKVSKSKNRAQRAWIAKVELRIHATRQALSSIKSLKVLGLCNRVEEVIAGFRSTEIATSRKFRSLIFWEVLICKRLAFVGDHFIFSPFASY